MAIKDIEKRYKKFPEVCYQGSAANRLAWVVMDVLAEDPRGKSNNFRVTPYNSLLWRNMDRLGAYTIKELQLKELSVMSGEDSKPPIPPKKKKGCKQKNHRAKSKAKVETE